LITPSRLCVRYSLSCGLLGCGALIALALPGRAHAELIGKASATAQYESNSNVFDSNLLTPSSVASSATRNDSRRSDVFYAYGAQFDTRYSWRRQLFYVTAGTTQYDYQRFTRLNHNSYNVSTGVNLQLAAALDGKVDVTRSRTMVPFYNLNVSGPVLALSLVTDQKETAQVGLRLNSRWRVESSVSADRSQQPVVGAPNLEVYQNSATASIDYLGLNGITSGITGTYAAGEYIGSVGTLSPTYNQTSAGFLVKYDYIRSSLDGQIGYSRRNSSNSRDDTSGLTGQIDFTDHLTPKTTVTAKVGRTINNYIVNSGSEIDTDLAGTVTWQATYKSNFSVSYTFSYRDFPGQGNNPVGSRRVDIQEYVSFGINYQPQPWLLLRPYYNAQTRRSTAVGNHYSSTIFGLYVTVMTPERRKRAL
jgi:hypothetical protein